MKPLERLFEREGLSSLSIPAELATLYGGELGLARPLLYANFVSSLDGVVALSARGESGRVVSGDSEPDRFVMGLLRAMADAVLIGAGTFRQAAGDLWLPEAIYPAAAGQFAHLRKRLGLTAHPRLVVVTASGNIDAKQPALRDCLVLTTPQGQARLQGALSHGARLVVLDDKTITGGALLEALHAEGMQVILTEGGPTLIRQLIEEDLLDELFLTSSPRLFGRRAGDGRKSLLEGADLGGRALELLSLRRHASHLFARYALRAAG